MSGLRKFGQYVHIKVHNKDGSTIFSTDSLRVDFDIREIPNWNRARFSIYNLTRATMNNISNGNNYVTLKVGLHGSEPKILASNMYISNAMEEIKVPDSIFSMYTVSSLKKETLENVIAINVFDPNLKRILRDLKRAAKFSGEFILRYFPEELITYSPPTTNSNLRGTLMQCLRKLGRTGAYKFNVYIEGKNIVLMYKPDVKNFKETTLYDSKNIITLSTDNMRSNPKLGPATLSVTSNLDPDIKPSSILNISELITVGTDISLGGLEVAPDLLTESTAGYSNYQAIKVQHKGSNWSDGWLTQVVATSPTKGIKMSADKWWA